MIKRKKYKVIHSNVCFGCSAKFKTRAKLELHQGSLWPGCEESNKLI